MMIRSSTLLLSLCLLGAASASAQGISESQTPSVDETDSVVQSEVETDPILVVAPSACDDEACARTAYEAGAAAFDAEHYAEALGQFQRSYEQTRLPALLFNMASCHDRLGATEEAIRFYRAFLAAQPEADNRPYVESRVLLIQRPETDNSQPEVIPPAPTAVPLAPDFTNDSPTRAGPITLLALGGASAAGAVIMGVLAGQSSTSLEENCNGLICPVSEQGTYDSMRQQALASDVLSGVALGLVTVGIVWWVFQSSGGNEDVQVRCGITGCAASGSF